MTERQCGMCGGPAVGIDLCLTCAAIVMEDVTAESIGELLEDFAARLAEESQ